jgi:DUF971 family protein
MGAPDHVTLLRLHAAARRLEVEWEDGATAALPYAALRERCPCAECRQGRRTGGLAGAVADVAVLAALPCGPNAVQLQFSDGHDRGIFPFPYLRELRDELAAAISK